MVGASRRMVVLAAAMLAATGLVTAQGLAQDSEKCFDVEDASLEGQFTGPLSTAATLKGAGQLNGSTEFTGQDSEPSAGLDSNLVPGSTVSYTGILKITTNHGVLTLRDVGIFDTDVAGGDGEFTSRSRVLSGTQRFEDATGLMFFHGDTQSDSTFTAEANGQVCVPE